MDKNQQPIRIDGRVAADVERNARNVLALAKRGANVIFPDVFAIFQVLEQQFQQAEAEQISLPTKPDNPGVLTQLHCSAEQTEFPDKHHPDLPSAF